MSKPGIRLTFTKKWLAALVVTLLALAQTSRAALTSSTVTVNGTNITTFTVPSNALPAFIRVKQTYP